MSIEARLVEAFDGLMNSHAAANTYKGDDAEYITFNYTEIIQSTIQPNAVQPKSPLCVRVDGDSQRGER